MSTGTAAKKAEGTPFPTRNDIAAEKRAKLASLLNQHLADLFDLMSQTKFAHWNVKGPNFYQLHLLFDTLAEKVEGLVDEVAERVTALGGVATGTARQAVASWHGPQAEVKILTKAFHDKLVLNGVILTKICLLYTSPSPRD